MSGEGGEHQMEQHEQHEQPHHVEEAPEVKDAPLGEEAKQEEEKKEAKEERKEEEDEGKAKVEEAEEEVTEEGPEDDGGEEVSEQKDQAKEEEKEEEKEKENEVEETKEEAVEEQQEVAGMDDEEKEDDEEKKDDEENEEEAAEEDKQGSGDKQADEGERYKYVLPQWQWSHHWQRREWKAFLALCTRTLDRSQDDRPLEQDMKKLVRGWQFVVENLDTHAQTEEELFFPALRKAFEGDADACAVVDHLQSDHKTLEAKLHALGKEKLDPLLAPPDEGASEGAGDEAKNQQRTKKEELQAFMDAVSELLGEYGEHIDEEERVVVPLVKRLMPEKNQREVGQSIKSHHQQLSSGKLGLLLMRDTVAELPEELALYNTTFPWFLRKVLMPVFAATDKMYKEYKTVFYEPWP